MAAVPAMMIVCKGIYRHGDRDNTYKCRVLHTYLSRQALPRRTLDMRPNQLQVSGRLMWNTFELKFWWAQKRDLLTSFLGVLSNCIRIKNDYFRFRFTDFFDFKLGWSYCTSPKKRPTNCYPPVNVFCSVQLISIKQLFHMSTESFCRWSPTID